MVGETFVDSGWYVLYSVGWVVAFTVHVLQCCIRFCVGLVGVLGEVKCDVEEVDDLFISFDGDF